MTESTEREAIVRYRWRVFLVIEVILWFTLAGCIIAIAIFPSCTPWMALVIAIMATWLIFSLPVAVNVVLYLLDRVQGVYLSPLIPSAESRAFRRVLKERPVLSDADFFAQYYAESGVPEEIPIRIRKICAGYDSLLLRLQPTDDLQLWDDEFDLYYLVKDARKAFGIRFESEQIRQIDGTFDNFVRLVHDATRPFDFRPASE